MIPARREFLERLREVTARHGILLILDEIITLRLAPGGAQSLYEVSPDLTVAGKIIGGGYPVAAFGGRAEIMALLDPEGGRPAIPQSGTYNGNPFGMVAGSATLAELTPAVHDRPNAGGGAVGAGVRAVFRRSGVSVRGAGI